MLDAYREHVAERAALGIPPTPLSAAQVAEVTELLNAPPEGKLTFCSSSSLSACHRA